MLRIQRVEEAYRNWTYLVGSKPLDWYFDQDVKDAWRAYLIEVEAFRKVFNTGTSTILSPWDSVTIISEHGSRIMYLRNITRPNSSCLGGGKMIIDRARNSK